MNNSQCPGVLSGLKHALRPERIPRPSRSSLKTRPKDYLCVVRLIKCHPEDLLSIIQGHSGAVKLCNYKIKRKNRALFLAVSRICPTFAVTTGQSTIVDVATQKTGRSLAQNGRTLFSASLLLQRPSTSRTILLRFNFSTNILARIMCVSETSVKQNLYLLKKKMGLGKEDDSVRKFIQKF